jgi:hypothetical protein
MPTGKWAHDDKWRAALRRMSNPQPHNGRPLPRKARFHAEWITSGLRLLAANIWNHISKRGLAWKCYPFPVGFFFQM